MAAGAPLLSSGSHRLFHPAGRAPNCQFRNAAVGRSWAEDRQFRKYVDLVKVIKCAEAKGHNLLAEDYARSTVDKRKKFLDMHPALKSLNTEYGPFHPGLFKVTYNDKTTTSKDPVLL
ncbi:hypothetical protein NDU88_003974 [Pleurodeles waltl]|uniref:Uncharacterized protein n=1 Tax=Pleurodeles waltl TaxID=8319 RepID=A0AAV7SHG3_PLEWA|nr:hypothetical protein NDU88_003974 [Pleurodeles waltl]